MAAPVAGRTNPAKSHIDIFVQRCTCTARDAARLSARAGAPALAETHHAALLRAASAPARVVGETVDASILALYISVSLTTAQALRGGRTNNRWLRPVCQACVNRPLVTVGSLPSGCCVWS